MRNLIVFCVTIATSLLLSQGAVLAAEIDVVDGDRFVMPDGEMIRVQNIRTPSINNNARCFLERQTGEKTIARVKELFAECPPVIDRIYKDRRGRTEARVEVCGRDLGELLMSEGLATLRDVPGDWCRSQTDQ